MTQRSHLTVLAALSLLVACGAEGHVIEPHRRAAPHDVLRSADFGEWSAPVNLGPVVNSEFNDLAPEMSKDGLSLYFGSNRPGGLGGNDIYVSRRASVEEPWGAPVNLGSVVNSTANEAGVSLSRDGHTLYFTSTRPGFGGNDLWVSWRDDIHDDFAWQAPVNLGPPMSTAESDLGPSTWGPEFYFWRAPPVTTTPGDIYVSRMIGDTFGEPEPVTALNSAAHDEKPSIRFDGREMFFASNRAGTFDLWVANRSGNGQEWSAPTRLVGPMSSELADRRPALSADGTMLFFDSTRPGGSGNVDLYVAVRARSPSSP